MPGVHHGSLHGGHVSQQDARLLRGGQSETALKSDGTTSPPFHVLPHHMSGAEKGADLDRDAGWILG